ncbi:hypothetical protein [Schaalia cardiffensis]|nr:hypothetical protein [Schaalia cardiffensis]
MKDMDTRSDSSAKSPFPSRAQMTRARLAAEAEASIEKARSATHDAPRSAEGAALLNAEGSAPLEAERAIAQDTQSTPQHTSENAERLASGTAAGVNSEGIAGLNSENAAGVNSESTAGLTSENGSPLGAQSTAPHSLKGAVAPWKSRKDESLSGESTPALHSRSAPHLRSALHSRSAPHRRSTPIEGFTSASMPIDSGMRVSALSVLLFSALTIAAWALPGAAWSFSPVIVVAGLALALGWNALTGMELPVPTIGVLALSALFVPLMVAYTHNLGSVVPVAGVASSLLIAATVMSLPAPRDRSREERAGDPPQGNPPQGRGTRPARSVAPPASTIHEDDNLQPPRRATPVDSSMPNYLVLSHAIAAQALIMSGTAWVALDALNQWEIIIPIAAIIIAAVVWGDQIGSSYRSQSLGALGTGVLAGVIAASAFWGVGMMTSVTPIVLPGVTHVFGRLSAVLLLGGIAGLSVALSVIVLDGLLGDHIMRRPPLGALARGAAKFLVAATPIYAIVRIGGI